MREIRLYGPIGSGYDPYSGVRMLDEAWLVDELAQAGGDDVELLINSDGGSVWTAKAMTEEIARYQGNVTSIITAVAASAATFLPMTSDQILIAPGAQMMIHDPWSVVAGNAAQLREYADHLDRVRDDTLIPTYQGRMKGVSEDDLRSLLQAETWLSAERAIEYGLADDYSRKWEGEAAMIRPDGFCYPADMAVCSQNPDDFRAYCLEMRSLVPKARNTRTVNTFEAAAAARRENWLDVKTVRG